MLTGKTLSVGMLMSIVEQLESSEQDPEVAQTKYLCERFLYSYLNSVNTEQRQACDSILETIESLDVFLQQAKNEVISEIERLDSQEKHD